MSPLANHGAGPLAILFVVLLTACGGGSDGSDAPEPPPPAPTLSLTATPLALIEGETTTLTWSSTGTTACTASGAWSGPRALSGSEAIADLAATATFTLTCRGDGGEVAGSVTVTVEPAPNSAPVIGSFRTSDASVDLGTAVTFSWTTSDADGDSLRCVLDVTGAGPEFVFDGCDGAISQTYTFPEPGSYTPALSVSDTEATVTARIAQTVNDAFRITMIEPRADELVDQQLRVRVYVQSPVEVRSVRATVASSTTDLLPADTPPEFAGTLSLAGLPRGEKILEIVAEDTNGARTRFVRRVVYDQPPQLFAVTPLAETVATTTVRVTASCTDDDPAGCTIEVIPNADRRRPVLASGHNSIDVEIDLAAYDGQSVPLRIEAVDSAYQRVPDIRRTYVEASDRLERLLDAPGPVLDVVGQRVLHLVPGNAGDGLGIRDFVLGTAEEVPVPAAKRVNQKESLLAPAGAIFVTTDVGGNVLSARLYQSAADEALDLGTIDSTSSLEVAGRYAIYNRGAELLLRDLVTGATVRAGGAAGNIYNSVAADGTVALWNRNYQIELVQNGSVTTLTSDPSLWNVYPLTDGKRVLYRKQTPCCSNQTYGLTLHDGIGEITIREAIGDEAPQGRGYQIVPDWVAYVDLGNLGQRHVWLYGPTGERVQLTFLGTSSAIDRLAPDGTVMLTNQEGRYLGHPDGTSERIGSTPGRSYWIDGTWYVAIGRSLFRVVQ